MFESIEIEQRRKWQQLVLAAADENPPDSVVGTSLRELGKSPAELAAAVVRLRDRRQSAAVFERLPAAEAGLDDCRRAHEALAAERQAALQQFEQRRYTAGKTFEAAVADVQAAHDARRFLLDTASAESRAEALGPVEAEIEAAKVRLQELYHQRRDLKNSIQQTVNRGDSASSFDQAALPERQAALRQLLQSIAAADSELQSLQEQHEQALLQLLLPEAGI